MYHAIYLEIGCDYPKDHMGWTYSGEFLNFGICASTLAQHDINGISSHEEFYFGDSLSLTLDEIEPTPDQIEVNIKRQRTWKALGSNVGRGNLQWLSLISCHVVSHCKITASKNHGKNCCCFLQWLPSRMSKLKYSLNLQLSQIYVEQQSHYSYFSRSCQPR